MVTRDTDTEALIPAESKQPVYVQKLKKLKAFADKTHLLKKVGIKYKTNLLATFFTLLKEVPSAELSQFVEAALALQHIQRRELFLPTSNVRKMVGSQLNLLFIHYMDPFRAKDQEDLFPFLNKISAVFLPLISNSKDDLFENFIMYCLANNQQDNFDKFMNNLARWHPLMAEKTQKKLINSVALYLRRYQTATMQFETAKTEAAQTETKQKQEAEANMLKMLCANRLHILVPKHVTPQEVELLAKIMPKEIENVLATPKKNKSQKKNLNSLDEAEEPLLPKGTERINPMYTLSDSLPANPTPADLQASINLVKEPEQRLWFNYCWHSSFPRNNTKPVSSGFVRQVAKLMDSVKGFFDACDKKTEGPILRAKTNVVKSLKKVLPDAKVDWMFGDVEQRYKEFQKHQKEAELENFLCVPGGQLSIMRVLFACVGQQMRIISFDPQLTNKIKTVLKSAGELNDFKFDDFNFLLSELAIAQDRLSPKLSAQQELNLLDAIYHEIYQHFITIQTNDKTHIYEDLLRVICLNWWEICRLFPETEKTLFHTALFTHAKNQDGNLTLKPGTLASAKDCELGNLYSFLKTENQYLTEAVLLKKDENLRPGIQLVISKEAHQTLKPGH